MKTETRFMGASTGPRPTPGQTFGGMMIEHIEIGSRLHEIDTGRMLVWSGQRWEPFRTRTRVKRRAVRQLGEPGDEC